jgi:hypothetical protein
MGGNVLVPIVMFGWIPVVFYIFLRYPPQRAVVISFIIAWLFLPVANFKFPGIPDYSKMTATSYGILLATAVYDIERFRSFKVSWIDIPIFCWCIISPMMSSLTNDLGLYDAVSSALNQTVTWGIPYFLGRIYLNNLAGLRKLAIGIFIGGLAYIPFIWIENRTFSSLHTTIYGLDTGRDLAQSFRLGGYRAQVFMEHGLMLGVWMMSACIMGIVVWRMGLIKRIWNQPIGLWFALLLVTFINARSTGAYNLFLIGAATLFIAWRFKNSLLLWGLTAAMCFYLLIAATGNFPGKEVIAAITPIFPEERVQSLQFRFENEEILGLKARQQPVFGWGGFGRNRVFNEMGEDVSVTDSLWIIAFGVNGAFGLIALMASILLPVLAFCIRYPARMWSHPNVAPAAALAICVFLYTLDCVLNAMVNPIFMLAAGGLAGIAVQPKQAPVPQVTRQLVRA